MNASVLIFSLIIFISKSDVVREKRTLDSVLRGFADVFGYDVQKRPTAIPPTAAPLRNVVTFFPPPLAPLVSARQEVAPAAPCQSTPPTSPPSLSSAPPPAPPSPCQAPTPPPLDPCGGNPTPPPVMPPPCQTPSAPGPNAPPPQAAPPQASPPQASPPQASPPQPPQATPPQGAPPQAPQATTPQAAPGNSQAPPVTAPPLLTEIIQKSFNINFNWNKNVQPGAPPQNSGTSQSQPPQQPANTPPPQNMPPAGGSGSNGTPQAGPPQAAPPQGTPPQGASPQGAPPQGVPPQAGPPKAAPPQGPPPQGPPCQEPPPQGPPPQGPQPQGSPPQGSPPQAAPPQGAPPQAAPPQLGSPQAPPPQAKTALMRKPSLYVEYDYQDVPQAQYLLRRPILYTDYDYQTFPQKNVQYPEYEEANSNYKNHRNSQEAESEEDEPQRGDYQERYQKEDSPDYSESNNYATQPTNDQSKVRFQDAIKTFWKNSPWMAQNGYKFLAAESQGGPTKNILISPDSQEQINNAKIPPHLSKYEEYELVEGTRPSSRNFGTKDLSSSVKDPTSREKPYFRLSLPLPEASENSRPEAKLARLRTMEGHKTGGFINLNEVPQNLKTQRERNPSRGNIKFRNQQEDTKESRTSQVVHSGLPFIDKLYYVEDKPQPWSVPYDVDYSSSVKNLRQEFPQNYALERPRGFSKVYRRQTDGDFKYEADAYDSDFGYSESKYVPENYDADFGFSEPEEAVESYKEPEDVDENYEPKRLVADVEDDEKLSKNAKVFTIESAKKITIVRNTGNVENIS